MKELGRELPQQRHLEPHQERLNPDKVASSLIVVGTLAKHLHQPSPCEFFQLRDRKHMHGFCSELGLNIIVDIFEPRVDRRYEF